MAGIDKTYIKSWEEFVAVRDWCKSVGTVTDQFGNTFTPYDWIPRHYEYDDEGNETGEREWTQEYVENWLNEVRTHNIEYYCNEKYLAQHNEIWDTNLTIEEYKQHLIDTVDIPLWNTPTFFDIFLIKNCDIPFIVNRLHEQYSDYDEIRNGTSVYDTFKREGSDKFTMTWRGAHISSKWTRWYIDIIGCHYSQDDSKWYYFDECKNIHDDMCIYWGRPTKRTIHRLIKSFNLIKGTNVYITLEDEKYRTARIYLTVK